ncbi:hypothetical protein K3495_g168 [Podosphaera aphanis]|nr:hypothetical protein K3495_g168 [Podosphaera aphanis]
MTNEISNYAPKPKSALFSTQPQRNEERSASRLEEQVIEGCGSKRLELSPQELSREKRCIMIQKLCYGKRDEFRAVVAKKFDGRDDEVAGDFHLPLAARWSLFFTEFKIPVGRRLADRTQHESDGMQHKTHDPVH